MYADLLREPTEEQYILPSGRVSELKRAKPSNTFHPLSRTIGFFWLQISFSKNNQLNYLSDSGLSLTHFVSIFMTQKSYLLHNKLQIDFMLISGKQFLHKLAF